MFASLGNARLADLQLDSDVATILMRHNMITVKDVLNSSLLDLMELLDVSYSYAKHILGHVSQHVAPPYQTVTWYSCA
jgi:hypothetical protein